MLRALSVALNPALDISCETDKISPTKKTRTCAQRLDPGGGGINVAKVVKELGGTPELLYLSGGPTGWLLDELLKETEFVRHKITIQGSVRISTAVHESTTNVDYRFVPEGPLVSDAEFGKVVDFLSGYDGDYLILSGSLPRGVDKDCYSVLADVALKNGVRVILDTSGPALQYTLENSRLFLVKPSLEELEEYAGQPLSEHTAARHARELIAKGATDYVAVSMGPQGAFLAGPDGVLRLPAQHVITKSAVGAGDSFVGGLAFALLQGRSMEEAFRYGVAAGTAAVMTPGTALCRAEDVTKLLSNISVDA